MQTPQPDTTPTFENFEISSQILNALSKLKITTPTPIQQKSIPVALSGKDVLGIAQTGTGKTFAFGIPLIQRLDQLKGRALILLPTRELALQVNENLHKIATVFNMKTAVLIGGESMGRQIDELRRQPKIIIATPGRLIDHLEQRRVQLNDIKILVLDEADRMLDMGFAPQLNQILKAVPKERQTMLFSATMPSAILKLATTYMNLPIRVEVAPAGSAAADIEQEVFIVSQQAKLSLLERLLQDYQGTVLVFSRTKFGAKKITSVLKTMGHHAAEIHSNRTQAQRREALYGFKSGRYRILVATDIAARGIDVNNIELVINFDLPDNSEDYVHRIGRTGRAGKKGVAISFATPQQNQDIRAIERLMRKTLNVSKWQAPPGSQDLNRAAKKAERHQDGREDDRDFRKDQRPARHEKRPHREENRDRGNFKSERAPRFDRSERSEKSDRPARFEKSERPEKKESRHQDSSSPKQREHRNDQRHQGRSSGRDNNSRYSNDIDREQREFHVANRKEDLLMPEKSERGGRNFRNKDQRGTKFWGNRGRKKNKTFNS